MTVLPHGFNRPHNAPGIEFPRRTLLRARRVLSTNNGDRALVDLHSGNQTDPPALTYMMFFPFIDSLWYVAVHLVLLPMALSYSQSL